MARDNVVQTALHYRHRAAVHQVLTGTITFEGNALRTPALPRRGKR